MDNRDIDGLARKIWDYHLMNQALERADCIIVFGSKDLRVVKRGVEIFLEGWAPYILFSGGLGRLTKDSWAQAEAERFAEVAERSGIPEGVILIENKSTNTGENIQYSINLLKAKGINFGKIIAVSKPYTERRVYATVRKLCPEVGVIVASPNLSFEEYITKDFTRDFVINMIVGDLQRIKVYGEKGYQIPQEIPEDVWDSYKKLVERGYDKYIIG
jgi:uncharacterized SAM-binding protein YcdF (DUF218 family)